MNVEKNIKGVMVKLHTIKMILTQECNSNIEHDSVVFETFYCDFRNDNIKKYNTVTSA